MTIEETGTIKLTYNPKEKQKVAEKIKYLVERGYYVSDFGSNFYLLKLNKTNNTTAAMMPKGYKLRWGLK